jgi:c-di-GMP-binding flagellar brake protein YcgR
MFFRKKKIESRSESSSQSPGSDRDNQRKQYRVRAREAQPIRASLPGPAGLPIVGRCIDLSIGGTWVEFDAAQDPRLHAGGACELEIRAESRTDGIHAACSVVTVQPLRDGRIRVGFQFTNRIELYAQLDRFYARLFNRRRHVRAASAGDVPIPVRIMWHSGSMPATAHDISEGGVGLVMPGPNAVALVKVREVELSFRLPKERSEIVCRAVIKSRTEFGNSCLLGLEFVAGGGIERHLPAVRRCVALRLAAFESWNTRTSKRGRERRAS